MYCRGRGLFAADQLRPPRTVPALKAIAPNAAFPIVIPFANGLHERENVETLLLSQIHFQPARGLSLIQAPARSEVTVVRFVRSYSIRVATGMNGLTRRQIARRDDDMLAELRHAQDASMPYQPLPSGSQRLARTVLLGSGEHSESGCSVCDSAARATHLRQSSLALEVHWRLLLPEPFIREGHTWEGRHVNVARI
jgi:hypothetical protein